MRWRPEKQGRRFRLPASRESLHARELVGAAAARPPTGWRLDDRGKVDRSVVDAIEDVGEDGQGDRLALIIRSLRVMGPSFFTFRIPISSPDA
jgi:hypothetical protein